MVYKCCVPRCNGNYDKNNGVHIFKFPRDENLIRKWLTAIRREDYLPTRHSVVCHRHFTESDIRRYTQYYDAAKDRTLIVRLKKIRLREGAVPSVFAWSSAITGKSVISTTHNSAI